MKLSSRIRQLRYAKGWGPDDLASRANISRTALYQIESGRTGLPRAATLRRIARALGVSPEKLLGEDGPEAEQPTEVAAPQVAHEAATPTPTPEYATRPASPTFERAPTPEPAPGPMDLMQELEIERKFRMLLHSPLRDAMVKIVEQSYRLLPPDARDLTM